MKLSIEVESVDAAPHGDLNQSQISSLPATTSALIFSPSCYRLTQLP